MPRRTNDVDRMVGARIRLRRKEMGMTQPALARQLGTTFQQVQKYEKGTNRIGAGRLEEIAKALEVPVPYLFNDDGANSAEPSTAPCAAERAWRIPASERLFANWGLASAQSRA